MKSSILKKYPPYTGSEPYVFLCFAKEDAAAVEPLLSRLYRRGCRVWYPAEESSSIEQEKLNQKRMKNAGLVMAFCTGAFLKSSAKGRMMFLQAENIPVIAIDREETDVLSSGLHQDTPHINAVNGITYETEAELISADGFSQDFIGPRIEEKPPKLPKIIFSVLAALTAAALVFFALVYTGKVSLKKQEPVQITELYFERLPDDFEELKQYPELKKIIIPQSEAERALALSDNYTIVIKGGSAS